MKVESVFTAPSFQPITVTIQIESEEELQAVRSFMGRDCTIPGHARSSGWITSAQAAIVNKMMHGIHHALCKD